MIKTYISALLVMLLAGAQAVQAQESLDDVFAQLEVANDSGALEAAPEAAESVEAAPAEVVDGSEEEINEADASAAVRDDRAAELNKLGKEYYRNGQYDQAEAAFEAALAVDPYNGEAMTYLNRAAGRVGARETRKLGSTRARAMSDISAAWNPAPKVNAVATAAGKRDGGDPDAEAKEAMVAMLKGINIPSLDFRDANIGDVVLFLTESCRRQNKNVNILLLGSDDSGSMDQNNITISLRELNLYESLQYIVEMASLKFEIKPSVVVISPVNYVASVDMEMRTYTVMSTVGEDLESLSGGDSGGADDLFGDSSDSGGGDGGPVDVAGFFSIVDFPDGASASYQPRYNKLFVKNTPKNLRIIEGILADLEDEAIKKMSQQVEIEAKFVEFNEGDLEELGFDWTIMDDIGEAGGFGLSDMDAPYYRPGTGLGTETTLPDGTKIYTDPVSGYREITGGVPEAQNVFGAGQRDNSSAFESVQSGILAGMGGSPAAMVFENSDLLLRITAMDQAGTADVLSAPKVTTKSGNEAVIRVVEVHRYPQDYDVETGQRTAPVVKPQDWEDYDLGVVLKVTPVVDTDTNTIDLDLMPEITKFKGFDDYIVGYNAYETGNNVGVTVGNGNALLARMPFFEKRAVQTQVTISDGHTVLMGGLVDERTETFRDQVPFLGDIPYIGRFFRTEGSRSAKKNLVIYVKATQVDSRGMTSGDRKIAHTAEVN